MSTGAGASPTKRLALSEHLQNLSEALTAARTSAEIFNLLLPPALAALGALGGAVWLVSEAGDSLEIAATGGYKHGEQPTWPAGPLSSNHPASDALARHTALYFESRADLTAYPELEARPGTLAGAWAVLPLFVDQAPLGVLVLDFAAPRRFAPDEQQFLRTLAAQGALALSRANLQATLEQRVLGRTALIEEQARSQVAFATFTELVGRETDVLTLCHKAFEVMDTHFTDYSSVYYEWQNSRWTARAWTENLEQEIVKQLRDGLPSETPFLQQAIQAQKPIFLDHWDAQQLAHTEMFGPVCTYPLVVEQKVRGVFVVGLRSAAGWQMRERSMTLAIGRSLNLALARTEQARQLEAERAALDAFVAYSELAGVETDLVVLAQRAIDVLQVHFQDCSGGYYARSGQLWSLRSWTADLNSQPEFLASLRAGLPGETPFIAELLQTREPSFTESWDADSQGVANSDAYGTVAAYPVVIGAEVQGFITLGLKSLTRWNSRHRTIFRSVCRSLTLAVERAEHSWRLAAQNAELEAHSRALDSFSTLLGDLSLQTDSLSLIRSALAMVINLLPPGYAAFWEIRGDYWRATAQTPDVGSQELQSIIDAGLPVGQTPTLDIPYQTRAPYFQDVYAQGMDTAPEVVRHVNAVATLPVMVRGEVMGIFNVPLFHVRRWSAEDRAVLETTVRSLGLALERAEGVINLARRTEELARSNVELEQFAYVASHDLQAPIRAVTSFAGIIERRYGQHLDERGKLYLRQIMDSGEHMRRLVEDLLAFSRVHTEQHSFTAVDSAQVFDQVLSRLQPAAGDAVITRGELPRVLADSQQLDQLLQNLISNGLKYQRGDSAAQIHVCAKAADKMWRFEVQDNGIGIEPQYFARIFEIFQRLHDRQTYEGTGIGLAICQKIAERHGGKIWLESTPGQGTTFFFTLPKAD